MYLHAALTYPSLHVLLPISRATVDSCLQRLQLKKMKILIQVHEHTCTTVMNRLNLRKVVVILMLTNLLPLRRRASDPTEPASDLLPLPTYKLLALIILLRSGRSPPRPPSSWHRGVQPRPGLPVRPNMISAILRNRTPQRLATRRVGHGLIRPKRPLFPRGPARGVRPDCMKSR